MIGQPTCINIAYHSAFEKEYKRSLGTHAYLYITMHVVSTHHNIANWTLLSMIIYITMVLANFEEHTRGGGFGVDLRTTYTKIVLL